MADKTLETLFHDTLKDAARLLDETLQEEAQTDVDLTAIADASINTEAVRPAA